jgi:hypothetical protein
VFSGPLQVAALLMHDAQQVPSAGMVRLLLQYPLVDSGSAKGISSAMVLQTDLECFLDIDHRTNPVRKDACRFPPVNARNSPRDGAKRRSPRGQENDDAQPVRIGRTAQRQPAKAAIAQPSGLVVSTA